jgi:hypothetical protein
MKIMFILGCLEQGRNGVGDYVRRLAGELIRLEQGVKIIALYEENIVEVIKEEQIDEQIKIEVLRIPASLSSAQRFSIAGNWLKDFDPDVLSLQYVSFSFDKKGLPFGFNSNLKKLGRGRKWNIMFHELWCGMNVASPFKERVLGQLQKFNIRRLFHTLKPVSVFTSITSYQSFLQQIGVDTQVLPIFGNISLNATPAQENWEEFIKVTEMNVVLDQPDQWLIIGFFGTTYENKGLKELLLEIEQFARDRAKRLAFLMIGHNRSADLDLLIRKSEQIKIIKTGLLSDSVLNKVLMTAHAGILTTPSDGLNKSGTAVAWIERGIPILVSSADFSYQKVEMEQMNIYKINHADDLNRAFSADKTDNESDRLSKTAKKYIETFKKSYNPFT